MSNHTLGLDQLTDQPELTVEIAGQKYQFSELPLEARGRLQAWIAQNVPNPIESIRGDLEGLSQEDRQYLLNEARKDRKGWPPDIESAAGKIALLGTEPGQLEALWEGLKIHQTSMTKPGAYKVMRALKKEAVADTAGRKRAGKKPARLGKVDRILGVMLGLDLPEDDEEEPAFPKDLALNRKSNGDSIGSYSSGVASKSSA